MKAVDAGWRILDADPSAPAPLVLGPLDPAEAIEPVEPLLGGWSGQPSQPLRLHVSGLGSGSVDLICAPLPLASTRLRDALERAGVDDVQWRAAELHERDGAVDRGWWLLHALGRVAVGVAPDHEAPFTVPTEAAVGRVLRIAELPTLLVVDGGVAAALGASALRGLRLVPTGDWHGW